MLRQTRPINSNSRTDFSYFEKSLQNSREINRPTSGLGHIPLVVSGRVQSGPFESSTRDTTTTNSGNKRAMDPESPLGKVLAARIRVQKQEEQCRSTASMFTRNLNEALDLRRSSNNFFITISNLWQVSDAVDFSSNDILALGSSGRLRNETLQELSNNSKLLFMGSGGSRVIDGNYTYIEEAEERMTSFFNAEAGLILNSGYEANVAIWTAIPRLGDVIVHDTLVHASTFEGMKQSLAVARKEFQHNDVQSFRDTLLSVADQYPLVKQGKRCILVAVESVYSMDGDICPLQDLVLVAKEVFPSETVQFVVDEAHGTGVLGHQGRGLVAALGLENEIAVRLHTFGKALAAGGGEHHANFY
jgi:8-amino-7-oxononanoate synthase